MGTARVLVIDSSGQLQYCRAVIDSGAQSSFITTECAQRLGLPRKKCSFNIYGLGGEAVKNHGMITCTLRSLHTDLPSFTLNMVVVTKVSADMPNVRFHSDVINKYKNFNLADPLFYKRSRIDILLGNDIVSELIKDKPYIISSDIPSVIDTAFGFVVSGKLYSNDKDNLKNYNLSVSFDEQESLDQTLRKFWEIEELPSKPSINPLEQLAEDIFVARYSRTEDGTYSVPLPFIPDPPPLGASRAAAERRLLFTERKLNRSPVLRQAYSEFMCEYENLGHMELYSGDTPSKYVIPHHSILKPSSSTTPLRVVFDASAKTSTNVSLNDILLTGPNLYRDIGAIILNFRLFEYCLICDVCKMYRAIKLNQSDRCYQHILYRHSPNDAIDVYELKTVTYGLSCSPFLAIRTLLQLANDEEERFPLAGKVVREGVYMDDILYSCSSLSQISRLQDELLEMFNSGGFILKRWASNSAKVLQRVPLENRERPVTFMKDGNKYSVKVLGLKWFPLTDCFYFTVDKTDKVTTKRSVLKLLASIYDPVGFISPCIFIAKEIMQDLWKLGIGWDEQLPTDVTKRWLNYVDDLPRLTAIKIDRHMLLPEQTECELVAFCDASSRGYASCVYVISRNDRGQTKVRLVTAKSKVAPVKPLTIPRLELMASVLLSKLIRYVRDILTRVKITRITALTDSTIVLTWLQTEAYKLKPFVSNRVTQVCEVLPPHCWRHVSSECNMADICSRGASPSQLVECSEQWLKGPSWLYDDYSQWPVRTFINQHESNTPEMKSNHTLGSFNLITNENNSIEETKLEFCDRIFSNFSSYYKLQRTFARILRWFRLKSGHSKQSILTTNELNTAQDVLIKLVQSAYFANEINRLSKGTKYVPSLRKLSPFIDERGYLRVGGRINYSALPYNAKHPRLLPKNSRFTFLLIEYLHKKYLHVGPRTLQNIINQNFWILASRRIIRSVLSKCKICFKHNPVLLQPEMAPLPAARLIPCNVFEHVGVDLGGPFFTKESLRRNARVERRTDDITVELHGFSDASNIAYAAVVYIRIVDAKGKVYSSLVTAKTKLAPIKQISIPRLELCGAVLVTKLLIEVAKTLNIAQLNLHAWTDSIVVLAWLSDHSSRWKTFVANRTSEILNLLESNQFSHVKSEDNPADCASRGISPAVLLESKLWKECPSWLLDRYIQYSRPKSILTCLEKKTVKSHVVTEHDPEFFENLCLKFSSKEKLIRVVAFCRRFLRFKKPNEQIITLPSFLTASEISESFNCLLRLSQQEAFGKEIQSLIKDGCISKKSVLITLNPFIDNIGLLRVGGRIHRAKLSDDSKHPIIISYDSQLAKLIVKDAHESTLHGGQQITINFIRSKFRILRVKNLVRSHIRNCITCIRYSATTQNQLMGQLPSSRVTPCKPFLRTGVDYAGPIDLRMSKGRGNKCYKGYICLFICMVTRAVHIEAVSDFTTQGFLAAFKRFVARRGHCSDIYSDNGTNFIGASKELKQLFSREKHSMLNEIASVLANNSTTWHFIPPRAPNFGGLWEAAIKSVKHHLRRIINNSTLTFEEMSTVLSQIEACLNLRPLSQASGDPDDPVPLTPGHFLIGQLLVVAPDSNYEIQNMSTLRRWQLTQRMIQNFWRRWSKEYLVNFFQRYKWNSQISEPKVDDIVLVKEDNLSPAKWLYGRVNRKFIQSKII
ncbi:unnamed protein product [Parnassius mnemosyne]|uniref:Integrase catalytic domain-containing protein n=1 Tax=Parnassius mnemosyne TaxID=213953 RepID=A0AAV1K8A7_9NEOP